MGVDFAGGILVEYRFDQQLDADHLRDAPGGRRLADAEIQASEGGQSFPDPDPGLRGARDAVRSAASEQILEALQKEIPGVQGELLREEVVGPRVGRELRGKAFWAVIDRSRRQS